MATKPITDEQLLERVEAHNRHNGSTGAAARELDLTESTVRRSVRLAAERGLMPGQIPAQPGFEIRTHSIQVDKDEQIKSQSFKYGKAIGDQFEMPEGQAEKGRSALVDAEGRVVQQWIKTNAGQKTPEQHAKEFEAAFAGFVPIAPSIAPPETFLKDELALLKFPDLHMGLYAWGKESGQNWDIKIAKKAYAETFSAISRKTPQTETAVVLGGGDQMHADNSFNRTLASGHALDVDGRYDLVLETTCHLFAEFVVMALQRHKKVIVRILKGNHDEHSSVALAYFLSAWFRNEPRVTVDVDPNLFWCMQFGSVMLFATHGHTIKPQNVPGVMAGNYPEIWGATKYRYGHCFHIHHKTKLRDESGGATVETHPSPSARDVYNWGSGYVAGQSLVATIYNKKYGRIGDLEWPVIVENASVTP